MNKRQFDEEKKENIEKQEIAKKPMLTHHSKQVTALSNDLMSKIGEFLEPVEFYIATQVIKIEGNTVIPSVQQYKWTNNSFIECFTKKPHYAISDVLWKYLVHKFALLLIHEKEFPITYEMISNFINKKLQIAQGCPIIPILHAIKPSPNSWTNENINGIVNRFKHGLSVSETTRMHIFQLHSKLHIFKQQMTIVDVRVLIFLSKRDGVEKHADIANKIECILVKFPEVKTHINPGDLANNNIITITLLAYRKDLINNNLLISFIGKSPRVCQYILENYEVTNKKRVMDSCMHERDHATFEILLRKKFQYTRAAIMRCFIAPQPDMCRVIVRQKLKLPDDILDMTTPTFEMTEICLTLLKRDYKPSTKLVTNAVFSENVVILMAYKPYFKPIGAIEKNDAPLRVAILRRKYFLIQYLIENDWPLPPVMDLVQLFRASEYDYETFFQVYCYIRKLNAQIKKNNDKLIAEAQPKAEAPKVEMPKVEEPKVEMPKAEAPKVEEPKVEMPIVEMPIVEEKKTEQSKSSIQPLYILPLHEICNDVIKFGKVSIMKLLLDTKVIMLNDYMVESLKTRGSIDIYQFVKDYHAKLNSKTQEVSP